MKLLFDQNLSHRLVSALEDLFPGSLHVRFLGLADVDDLSIWNYAKDHQLIIGTQDSDYSDWNNSQRNYRHRQHLNRMKHKSCTAPSLIHTFSSH